MPLAFLLSIVGVTIQWIGLLSFHVKIRTFANCLSWSHCLTTARENVRTSDWIFTVIGVNLAETVGDAGADSEGLVGVRVSAGTGEGVPLKTGKASGEGLDHFS